MTSDFVLVGWTEKYKRQIDRDRNEFVRDSSGQLVGCIIDYLIDEHSCEIIAFEMMRGYLGNERRIRIWVYSYEKNGDCDEDTIISTIISTDFRSGFDELKEETHTCGFQP